MSVIHFLNVKEGDCTIIQHDSGRVSVIDICNGNALGDEDEKSKPTGERGLWESAVKGNYNQKAHPENPIAYMHKLGIQEIFRFILTHPDMDHMDGIYKLFYEFNVCNFWDTKNNKSMDEIGGRYKKEDWEFYQFIRKSSEGRPTILNLFAESFGALYNQNGYGKSGGDGLFILSPTPELVDKANASKNYNELSYAIMLEEHGKKIIFAGDTEKVAWNSILERYEDKVRDIDVLIAPHHGRKSGGNDDFLDVLRPQLSLLGNAKSKDLDYSAWNNRGLEHFANNQGGNYILDITDCFIAVYCSNKDFAMAYNRYAWREDPNGFKAWYMGSV